MHGPWPRRTPNHGMQKIMATEEGDIVAACQREQGISSGLHTAGRTRWESRALTSTMFVVEESKRFLFTVTAMGQVEARAFEPIRRRGAVDWRGIPDIGLTSKGNVVIRHGASKPEERTCLRKQERREVLTIPVTVLDDEVMGGPLPVPKRQSVLVGTLWPPPDQEHAVHNSGLRFKYSCGGAEGGRVERA